MTKLGGLKKSLENILQEEKDFLKKITLVDLAPLVPFGTAAFLDYGWWPILWGICGIDATVNNVLKSERRVYTKIEYAAVGLFSMGASVGSFLTGDPKNAAIFGAVGIGMAGNLYSIWKQKKENKESLLQKIVEKSKKEQRNQWKEIWKWTKAAFVYTTSIALISAYSWIFYQNRNTFSGYFTNPRKHLSMEVTKEDPLFVYLKNAEELNHSIKEHNIQRVRELLPENNRLKKDVEKKLEQLIEADLTQEIGEKVNIGAHISGQKSSLILSRKDSLGQINYIPTLFFNPYLYRHLSDYEKLAVECLAEGLGLDASKIDTESSYIQHIAEMYKNPTNSKPEKKAEIQSSVDEIIKTQFKLDGVKIKKNRETYSAYVGQIGGMTINSPLFQIISVTNNASDIYELVFVYGHETGHSLITKHSNVASASKDYFSQLSGKERLIISESCADIVGEWAVDAFEKNHLKNPELIQEFNQLKEKYVYYDNQKTYEFLNNVENLLEQGQYEKVFEIYNERETLLKKKGYIHSTTNNALLSILQRYGGKEEINEMLKYIEGHTTKNEFLNIAARVMTVEELRDVYQKFGGKPIQAKSGPGGI